MAAVWEWQPKSYGETKHEAMFLFNFLERHRNLLLLFLLLFLQQLMNFDLLYQNHDVGVYKLLKKSDDLAVLAYLRKYSIK